MELVRADAKTNQEVYDLLDNNYVEDDDAMFRFQYWKEFIGGRLRRPYRSTGTPAQA